MPGSISSLLNTFLVNALIVEKLDGARLMATCLADLGFSVKPSC